MNSLFNPNEIARNLTGLVAAVVLGTTLIGAAVGPSIVANAAAPLVTATAQSNIVTHA